MSGLKLSHINKRATGVAIGLWWLGNVKLSIRVMKTHDILTVVCSRHGIYTHLDRPRTPTIRDSPGCCNLYEIWPASRQHYRRSTIIKHTVKRYENLTHGYIYIFLQIPFPNCRQFSCSLYNWVSCARFSTHISCTACLVFNDPKSKETRMFLYGGVRN